MKKSPEQLKESAFIDRLKNNHYVICPKDILFGYPDLPMQEKFAYLYLIQYGLFSIMNGHVDKDGNPIIYASQERLANDMKVSQPTVSRYCKKLEAHGLISIHSQGNGTSNYTTVYAPTYSSMNTEPIHPCIQYNRDTEKRDLKTDDSSSEETIGSGFTLKDSKKSKARKEQKSTKDKKVEDIISDIVSRPPKERKPKPSLPQKEKRVIDRRNSKTLFDHYSNVYEKSFDSKPPLSTGKDLKLLKDLIGHYGYDTTVGMVDYAVEQFDAFKRDKGIMGRPTIGVIYGFRAYLEEKAKVLYEEPQPTTSNTDDEESSW